MRVDSSLQMRINRYLPEKYWHKGCFFDPWEHHMHYTTLSFFDSLKLVFRKVMAKVYFSFLVSVSLIQLHHNLNPVIKAVDSPKVVAKKHILTKADFSTVSSPVSILR